MPILTTDSDSAGQNTIGYGGLWIPDQDPFFLCYQTSYGHHQYTL